MGRRHTHEYPPPIGLTLASPVERIFPVLTPAQVKLLAVHGQGPSVRSGEVLIEAGDRGVPFFVVTTGRIEIILPSHGVETLVTAHGPGEFTGEVTMLSDCLCSSGSAPGSSFPCSDQ
jgi:CRP-like cAMP-binding protein